MNKLIPLIAVAFCTGLTGCGKSEREVRHYREVNFSADKTAESALPEVEPGAPQMPGPGVMPELPAEMRAPSLPLKWATPAGWQETPGSGMRVVTFMVQGQECTILTFPGNVGGDEANIRRWLGQLGVSVSDSQLKTFVSNPVRFATAGGFECRYYDYSKLIPSGTPKNVLAGIIPVGDQTAFVKLMGDAAIVQEQRAAFESLCKSISLKPDSL